MFDITLKYLQVFFLRTCKQHPSGTPAHAYDRGGARFSLRTHFGSFVLKYVVFAPTLVDVSFQILLQKVLF